MEITLTRAFKRKVRKAIKIFKAWLVLAILAGALAVFGLVTVKLGNYWYDYQAEHYKVYAMVTEVNNHYVRILDTRGEEWTYFGHGFEVGEIIEVSFVANHTEKISDDRIVDARRHEM